MPEIFINGHAVQADANQTVMQAAKANGYFIPYFCWHPQLSIAGNCRICTIQVEGRSWVEIACNMPVSEGLRVLTDSELVRQHRKQVMQLLTLNHPVDCGICDKAGECSLQDYHYEYNGEASVSREPKVNSTKFHHLSERIVLDNERCILCTRCVRFTREISKSSALGVIKRGDASLLRCSEDRALDADPYADNVIDLCPVGALLSRDFFYKARVWYLEATPSVCPGCARGCRVQVWHRKSEWKLRGPDRVQIDEISRVTPMPEATAKGPWICNKGRDFARIFGRPRALQALRKGKAIGLGEAVALARQALAEARRPVALVSSWGSNEELAAFRDALGGRCEVFVKPDSFAEDGERVEDDFLIHADKNPNSAGARALFGEAALRAPAYPGGTDLVVVWGEACNFAELPPGAKIIFLNSWLQPENGHADVFIPISVQTERAGHYTNCDGVVNAFEACFAAKDGVVHAQDLFAALAEGGGS